MDSQSKKRQNPQTLKIVVNFRKGSMERHVDLVSGYFRSGKTKFIEGTLAGQYENPAIVSMETILDDAQAVLQRKQSRNFVHDVNPSALVQRLETERVSTQQRMAQMQRWTLEEFAYRLLYGLETHQVVIGENHSVYTNSPDGRRIVLDILRNSGEVESVFAYWMDMDLKGCHARAVELERKRFGSNAQSASLEQFRDMLKDVQPDFEEEYDKLFMVEGVPGDYTLREVTT